MNMKFGDMPLGYSHATLKIAPCHAKLHHLLPSPEKHGINRSSLLQFKPARQTWKTNLVPKNCTTQVYLRNVK